ncbi:hypothetical protein FYK55_28215 [Roseiconus nitratireducens]|uniref:Uncharacterized protein n=1 Tax=Roseiconus nitratireducens TaxID=2605748 RepID=A0A5M6CQ28_9BACT|nr:hypothetical protein [Roseiconus nitratireducens]KAA5536082.1 hypothetical protein FYK55_28215 [Roseiconus nitratireducens]
MTPDSDVNPFAPSTKLAELELIPGTPERLVGPYRVDLWAATTFLATLLNASSIWIFFTNGTGAILEPILTPLAQQSALWIPVYCFAVPLLIPFMPDTVRQTFAALFISVGLIFGINNLCGHFLGAFVFVNTFGWYQTVVCCLVIALLVFAQCVSRSGHFARLCHFTAKWATIAVCVHGFFFLVSRTV